MLRAKIALAHSVFDDFGIWHTKKNAFAAIGPIRLIGVAVLASDASQPAGGITPHKVGGAPNGH